MFSKPYIGIWQKFELHVVKSNYGQFYLTVYLLLTLFRKLFVENRSNFCMFNATHFQNHQHFLHGLTVR